MISTIEIEQHLHNMGYRAMPSMGMGNSPIEPRRFWGKPFGYAIMTFDVEKRELCQRFTSATVGDTRIWASSGWDGCESLTDFLARREALDYKSMGQGKPWDFQTEIQCTL